MIRSTSMSNESAALIAHSIMAIGILGAGAGNDTGLDGQATLIRQAVLRGAPDEIGEATYSHDSRTLATVSGSGVVQLWDLTTAREKFSFRERVAHGEVRIPASKSSPERFKETVVPIQFAFAFSKDGQFLAAVDKEAKSYVWSTSTGREIIPAKDLSASPPWGWPWPVVLFPAETPMFVGVSFVGFHPVRSSVRVWDLSTGKDFAPMKDRVSRFSEFAVSHDRRLIAVGMDRGLEQPDGTVEVWDVVAGRRIAQTTTGSLENNTLAFSHDDKTLITVRGNRDFAAGAWDFEVTAWDLILDVKKTSFKGSTKRRMYAAALSPDDKYLLAIRIDASIEVWNLGTGTRRDLEDDTIEPSMEIDENDLCPKGTLYVTRRKPPDPDGVLVRDWWSRRTIARLEGQTLAVFSPDGRILATAGTDDSITLWSISEVK
jgi:WD40 repeat protein